MSKHISALAQNKKKRFEKLDINNQSTFQHFIVNFFEKYREYKRVLCLMYEKYLINYEKRLKIV